MRWRLALLMPCAVCSPDTPGSSWFISSKSGFRGFVSSSLRFGPALLRDADAGRGRAAAAAAAPAHHAARCLLHATCHLHSCYSVHPQELDEAARRRLPKQLYIPLPCASARRLMLDRALGEAPQRLSSGAHIESQRCGRSMLSSGELPGDVLAWCNGMCHGHVRGPAGKGDIAAELSDAERDKVRRYPLSH